MPKTSGQQWQCRIAPSLGDGFAGSPNEVWGTKDYTNDTDPTVFFGLYGLPDFYALWRHKGRKAILWCGSDINHFKNGYWLDQKGEICLDYIPLAEWINKNCENYVENEVEQEALADCFIGSKVVPSFLGNVNDYPLSFKPGNKVYTSVSGDDFKLYGWDKIGDLANKYHDVEFHLYGNREKIEINGHHNVFIHGRVSQEQMNKEIKGMQGALRLTEFDGASELIVKAMLCGQYAFSFIEYPGVFRVDKLNLLTSLKDANIEGRDWWLKNLNQYPWNAKRNLQKDKTGLE